MPDFRRPLPVLHEEPIARRPDFRRFLEGPGNTFSYEQNRQFSDAYLPTVKAILGRYLLREANEEEDRTQATDLRVLTFASDDFRIGVRIRRPGNLQWWHQFTVRSKPQPSEYQKFLDGWCDWLFYGHAKQNDTTGRRLALWWIVNLDAWREAIRYHADPFDMDGDIPNFDQRGTHLRAYTVHTLVSCVGKSSIIGSSSPLEELLQRPIPSRGR